MQTGESLVLQRQHIRAPAQCSLFLSLNLEAVIAASTEINVSISFYPPHENAIKIASSRSNLLEITGAAPHHSLCVKRGFFTKKHLIQLPSMRKMAFLSYTF